jgi:hypothetical protein
MDDHQGSENCNKYCWNVFEHIINWVDFIEQCRLYFMSSSTFSEFTRERPRYLFLLCLTRKWWKQCQNSFDALRCHLCGLIRAFKPIEVSCCYCLLSCLMPIIYVFDCLGQFWWWIENQRKQRTTESTLATAVLSNVWLWEKSKFSNWENLRGWKD